MLLTWLLIFSVVLATLFLVAGVVYIPANQRFLLLITFPVVLRIAKQVNIHRRTYLSIVKDYSEQAKELYESHLQAVRDGREESLQALLVHWAHNDYFQQIYPKEFRWMLVRILCDFKEMYAGNRCCLLSFKWEFSHFMFGRSAISSRDIPAQYAC